MICLDQTKYKYSQESKTKCAAVLRAGLIDAPLPGSDTPDSDVLVAGARGDAQNWCPCIMSPFDPPKLVLSGLKEKIDSLLLQGLFLFVPVVWA